MCAVARYIYTHVPHLLIRTRKDEKSEAAEHITLVNQIIVFQTSVANVNCINLATSQFPYLKHITRKHVAESKYKPSTKVDDLLTYSMS